jgi:hypothetical protein
MRIVIEVDGEKVTVNGPDAALGALAGPVPNPVDAPPGPPPAALLERAKKLGAMSAGAAQFGRGAALASATRMEEEPRSLAHTRAMKAARKRARRSR